MPEREYEFLFCSDGCGFGDILQVVAVVAILVAAIALVWAFNVHLDRDIARDRRSTLKRTAQNMKGQRQHVAVEEQRYLDYQIWLAGHSKGRGPDGSPDGSDRPRRVAGAMPNFDDSRAGRATGARLSAEALSQQRRLRISQGRKDALTGMSGPRERRESVGDRAYRKHLEQTLEDQSEQDGEESVEAMTRVDWPNLVGGGGG